MLGVVLSISLFAYWWLIGYPALSLAVPRWSPLRRALAAPAMGIVLLVIPLFLLSRGGAPISNVAWPLGILLAAACAVTWWKLRLRVSARSYLAFAAILSIALIAVGRPFLTFGLDWVSVANDDMANYVLGAEFFAGHGFSNVPDITTLIQGADYSLYYWFFYIPHAVRPGSELLLAWLVSLTNITGHEAFMPLILASQLAMISATAALVYRSAVDRMAAIIAAILVSFSALVTFGTVSQLVAQVIGLSLLALCASIVLRPFRFRPWQALVGPGVAIGLIFSALLFVYPEVLPFLALAGALYFLIGPWRRRLALPGVLIITAVAGAVALLLINTYVIDVALFMSYQLTGGLRAGGENGFIFPYFLIPSGLADFWGLQTIDRLPLEPWRSLTIALGGMLLIWSTFQAGQLTRHAYPAAILAMVMLFFGVYLFVRDSDFGLFKLALFVQPFILATLAIGYARKRRYTRWRHLNWEVVPLSAVFAAGFAGQAYYVNSSASGFGEIPNGSQSGIMREFQDLVDSVHPQHLLLDTMNISLAKFQALYTRGMEATFPSRDFFSYIIGRDVRESSVVRGTYPAASAASQKVQTHLVPEFFALHDPSDSSLTNEFRIVTLGEDSGSSATCDNLLSTTGAQTVFNRREPGGEAAAKNFSLRPCSAVQNHLIFIHSKLGQNYYQVDQHYFGEDTPTIGIFALEPDPLLASHTMEGLGRHLLFEVVGPSPTVKLELNMTDTLQSDGVNQLPSASAIGSQRVAFPLVGRGSARVFSPPISPQMIDGHAFVAIDMGVDGERFTYDHNGLMGLFGTSIPFDRRILVGFARDVSLVSDSDYANVSPPSALEHFPDDLLNPNLEYSGVYEDGWSSESAYFILDQPADTQSLSIRGMVPAIDNPSFTSELQVLVDGASVASRTLRPGDFEVSVPAPTLPGKHRVDVRFSSVQRLSPPDKRPVASLIRSVGFDSAPAAAPPPEDIVASNAGIDVSGSGWYPLEHFNGETFRWVDNNANLDITSRPPGAHDLQIVLEPGPGVSGGQLTLEIVDADGRPITSVSVAGRQRVDIPVADLPSTPTQLQLHVDGGGARASADPRILNMRVFAVDWAN